MGVTGEGTRPDDLGGNPRFQVPQQLRVLESGAHQHFRVPLHKLLEDANHLLPASRGLKVGAAGAVGFLKEVGQEVSVFPCLSSARGERIRLEWLYLPGRGLPGKAGRREGSQRRPRGGDP